jgi:hypothetical protein
MSVKNKRNSITNVISHREVFYRLSKGNFLPRQEKIGIEGLVRIRELSYNNAHHQHIVAVVFLAIQFVNAQIPK